MRHTAGDRSAHDEMRQNLSRFDDPALLLDLYEEAHERITGSVGPDRSKEVAALEPRADVEAAQNELSATNDAIRRAGGGIADKPRHGSRGGSRPDPGAPSRTARRRDRDRATRARIGLAGPLRRPASRAGRATRPRSRPQWTHRRGGVRRQAGDASHRARTRRDVWLRDHSDEVRWADQLWERIEAQHSTERSDRRGRPGTKRRLEVRSPTHRPEVEQCGARSTDRSTIFDRSTVRGDAAIEAVLRRYSPNPSSSSSPPPPEREGPSLGR